MFMWNLINCTDCLDVNADSLRRFPNLYFRCATSKPCGPSCICTIQPCECCERRCTVLIHTPRCTTHTTTYRKYTQPYYLHAHQYRHSGTPGGCQWFTVGYPELCCFLGLSITFRVHSCRTGSCSRARNRHKRRWWKRGHSCGTLCGFYVLLSAGSRTRRRLCLRLGQRKYWSTRLD